MFYSNKLRVGFGELPLFPSLIIKFVIQLLRYSLALPCLHKKAIIRKCRPGGSEKIAGGTGGGAGKAETGAS